MKNNIRRCCIWRKASLATCVILFTVCVLPQPAQAQTQWTPTGTNISNANAGNVGVGTSAPTGKLSVELPNSDYINNGGANSHILLTNPSASGQTILESFINGSLAGKWRTDYVGNMSFATGGGSYSFMTGGDYPNGVNRFSILNSGNVGVGTNNPQSLLHVAGRIRTDNDILSIGGGGQQAWRDATASSAINFGMTVPGQAATNDIYFSTYISGGAWMPRMVISNASGNVGIGTSMPAANLEVSSPSATRLNITTSSTTSNQPGVQFTSNYSVNPGERNWYMGTSYYALGDFLIRQSNATGGDPYSSASSTPRFYIGSSGNVGIGTTAPATALHVVGDITVTGNINAKYQDVAEWVPTSKVMPAGTVVVLDATQSNYVTSSSKSYDTKVAGVISAQPGIALGEGGANKVLVATTGRVKVKVDATRAAIHVGDLLVTSDKEGFAMKSEPVMLAGRPFHSPGTLIGKALEPLASGTGEILVLLSLQ